eukprot:TRINITY_DN28676_c0_g1_i1.p2 TRINITY_DN28676_c0_g1~~TRINITY_DN28676_c0_g1_i1.p2  ORF type:complete len:256 (+),score=99.66 TRINITY_DN28676_c0_g1_i1:68-769(+)
MGGPELQGEPPGPCQRHLQSLRALFGAAPRAGGAWAGAAAAAAGREQREEGRTKGMLTVLLLGVSQVLCGAAIGGLGSAQLEDGRVQSAAGSIAVGLAAAAAGAVGALGALRESEAAVRRLWLAQLGLCPLAAGLLWGELQQLLAEADQPPALRSDRDVRHRAAQSAAAVTLCALVLATAAAGARQSLSVLGALEEAAAAESAVQALQHLRQEAAPLRQGRHHAAPGGPRGRW